MPANGNGSLSNAWARFDSDTKLDLSITELDRLHARIGGLQGELSGQINSARNEFTDRIAGLREEMRDGFEKQEKRQNRSIGLLYTMIGGIVVGLVLLVVQLAPH